MRETNNGQVKATLARLREIFDYLHGQWLKGSATFRANFALLTHSSRKTLVKDPNNLNKRIVCAVGKCDSFFPLRLY